MSIFSRAADFLRTAAGGTAWLDFTPYLEGLGSEPLRGSETDTPAPAAAELPEHSYKILVGMWALRDQMRRDVKAGRRLNAIKVASELSDYFARQGVKLPAIFVDDTTPDFTIRTTIHGWNVSSTGAYGSVRLNWSAPDVSNGAIGSTPVWDDPEEIIIRT